MTCIISGNWKMNGSTATIGEWFRAFGDAVAKYDGKINSPPTVLICPPAIYMEAAKRAADKFNETSKIKVQIGAQDCRAELKGAFTGDNSAAFVKDIGCRFAIVGHSERRQYHGETSEIVAKKAATAQDEGLTPLICIGETLEIREAGRHLDFVANQALESTDGVHSNNGIVIAYEPVWAIGTGKVATEDEVEEMCKHIKAVISLKFGIGSDDVSVLYGGSVNGANSPSILGLKSVDGVLVGGASLKGEEFFNIVKNRL